MEPLKMENVTRERVGLRNNEGFGFAHTLAGSCMRRIISASSRRKYDCS